MNTSRKLDSEPVIDEELPLFEHGPGLADIAIDPDLQVINRALALWDGIVRRVHLDHRSERDQRAIAELGRDLRALRDCYLAASHPRIRRALLDEARSITRRMKSQGRRLRVRGLAIRSLDLDTQLH